MVPPINEHQYELEPAEQDEPAYQDPAGYAVPSVNVPKAGTMSQPYEVPLSALSTLNVSCSNTIIVSSMAKD